MRLCLRALGRREVLTSSVRAKMQASRRPHPRRGETPRCVRPEFASGSADAHAGRIGDGLDEGARSLVAGFELLRRTPRKRARPKRGRRRVGAQALPTTCSSLVTSRERLRPNSMPVSGLPANVSPNAARCRSRRSAARGACIPSCEEATRSTQGACDGRRPSCAPGRQLVSRRRYRGCSVGVDKLKCAESG